MNKKPWIVIVIIIVIFLSAIAYYNYNKNVGIVNYPDTEDEFVQTPKETINALYKYKNNTHTFIGEITLPNPCYEIDTKVINNDNETEIEINTKEEQGMMCAQVITDKEFRVDFQAPEDQLIVASLNGSLVNLKIFEVSEDMEIEESELPKSN